MQPEVITTVAVGALLAMFTAILAWQGKGRFDALQREIAGVKTELKAEIAGVKGGVKGEIAGVKTEMAEMKSELKAEIAQARSESKADSAQIRTELVSIHATLAQVALAVGSQPRPQAG